MSSLEEVTDKSFDDAVTGNDWLLVDFWAPWCGPCQFVGPILEEVSKDISDLKIVKVNIDENMGTATKFGIRSIPTLILFNKGEMKDKLVGALPTKDAMGKWITERMK